MIYTFCLYHFSLKCIIKNLYLFSDDPLNKELFWMNVFVITQSPHKLWVFNSSLSLLALAGGMGWWTGMSEGWWEWSDASSLCRSTCAVCASAGLLAAKSLGTGRLLFHFQYLCGTIMVTLYSMVWYTLVLFPCRGTPVTAFIFSSFFLWVVVLRFA